MTKPDPTAQFTLIPALWNSGSCVAEPALANPGLLVAVAVDPHAAMFNMRLSEGL